LRQIVLDSIPFEADPGILGELLRIRKGGPDEAELAGLVGHACSIGRPRAVYGESFVDDRDDVGATIDAIRFRSKLLGGRLKEVMRVFPYCATCGRELEEWAAGLRGMKTRFWADSIMMAALGCAVAALAADIERRFRPGKISFLTPGSLEDWPLSELRSLFELIDGGAIGVTLNENLLMMPLKSVSGIMFPSEEDFQSCRYCSRENCPGRRAPYDPAAVGGDLHGN
jgi:hypothetical protein